MKDRVSVRVRIKIKKRGADVGGKCPVFVNRLATSQTVVRCRVQSISGRLAQLPPTPLIVRCQLFAVLTRQRFDLAVAVIVLNEPSCRRLVASTPTGIIYRSGSAVGLTTSGNTAPVVLRTSMM